MKKDETTPILRLEGGVVFVLSFVTYEWLGYSWWYWLLLLVPDIFMFGYAKSKELGALTYNLGHTYLTPALLLLIAYMFNWGMLAALAIIWVAHIGMDRLLGYGLKTPKGFEHTHLGKIGKTKPKG